MMNKPATYNIGDQVKLDPPQPGAFSCVAGHVVYHKGRHDPKNPRVRWTSGWGTTCAARDLALLPPEERFEVVTHLDCDLPR
jgi:hypothetical protein